MGAEIAEVGDFLLVGKEDLEHRIHALHHDAMAVRRLGDTAHFSGHFQAQILDLGKTSLIVSQHGFQHDLGQMQRQTARVVGAIVQNLTPFEARHDFGPPADHRHGQTAAQRLAIGDDVGGKPIDFSRAPGGETEASDGFIQIKQRAVLVAKLLHAIEVARFRRDHPHVRHHPFGDHASRVAPMQRHGAFQRLHIVPAHNDGVFPRLFGDARAVGDADRVIGMAEHGRRQGVGIDQN